MRSSWRSSSSSCHARYRSSASWPSSQNWGEVLSDYMSATKSLRTQRGSRGPSPEFAEYGRIGDMLYTFTSAASQAQINADLAALKQSATASHSGRGIGGPVGSGA